MGAWIETISNALLLFMPLPSLPSWERGLKPGDGAWLPVPGLSLPSWERGLKLKIHIENLEHGHVAPFMGAWIETPIP